MNTEVITEQFDYSLIADVEGMARASAARIRSHAKDAMSSMVEAGIELNEMKAIIPHGHFWAWVRAETSWSEDTADRWMRVARAFGQIPHGADFSPTALYLLSSPKVPEEARREAVERAVAGEKITPDVAEKIVEKVDSELNEAIEDDGIEPIDPAETSRPHGSTSFEEDPETANDREDCIQAMQDVIDLWVDSEKLTKAQIVSCVYAVVDYAKAM